MKRNVLEFVSCTFLLVFVIFLLVLEFVTVFRSPSSCKGVVTEKNYEPERKWVQPMPVAAGPVVILVPVTQYDDEDWAVTIQKDDEKAYIYLTKETWSNIQIGDYVNFCSDAQMDGDITKER